MKKTSYNLINDTLEGIVDSAIKNCEINWDRRWQLLPPNLIKEVLKETLREDIRNNEF